MKGKEWERDETCNYSSDSSKNRIWVKRSRVLGYGLLLFFPPVGQVQSAGKRRMFIDPEMSALRHDWA